MSFVSRSSGRLAARLRPWAASRYAARRRGAVAIEFAAVVVPFLLLLLGTLEISLILFSGAVLDGAAREAARKIRIGQAQTEADPLASFKTNLCDRLFYVACGAVVIDVRSFSNFTVVAVPPLYDAKGKPEPPVFLPGDAGEIVVVRTSYRWVYKTPLIATAFGADSQEVTATIVFRNEPFKLGT